MAIKKGSKKDPEKDKYVCYHCQGTKSKLLYDKNRKRYLKCLNMICQKEFILYPPPKDE